MRPAGQGSFAPRLGSLPVCSRTSNLLRKGPSLSPAPLAVAVLGLLVAAPVGAKPPGPGILCEMYPDAPACESSVPDCSYCHSTPPALNPFGVGLSERMRIGEPRPLSDADYSDALPAALAETEGLDADGDGYSNLEELIGGSFPGDLNSLPSGLDCSAVPNDWSPTYQVCEYDYSYAFKKVHLDVCGQSPSRSQVEAFEQSVDREQALHETLDACLQSEFWRGRDGIVWNLANRKIRPIASVKAGEDPGGIPLADYLDDYNLFVYTQIDDHDARDLLTAQYFVRRVDGETTTYEPYEATYFEELGNRGGGVAQLTDASTRAGMLTTRWNLFLFTMFTAVPRTTAAQAYRSYLGYEISRMEGLYPVENEPMDWDSKGVQQPVCAGCHSTLDPLSYPFSRYEGIGGGDRGILEGYIPGRYSATRLEAFTKSDGPDVVNTPEAGVIFGQPVANLVEWGQVAANSDAFAKATVLDYWKLLMGGPPRPDESAEFDMLWRAFMDEHGYGVQSMLHHLITTEAYGVP